MLQVLLTRGEEESNTAACRLQQAVTVCRLKSSLESRKEGSLGRRGGTLFLQVDLAGASSHTVGKWPIPGIVVQALQIAYVLKQLLILMTGSNLLVHFLEHRNLALHVFSFCQPPTSLPASCLGLFRLNLARSFLASTVQLLSKLLIASQTCQLRRILGCILLRQALCKSCLLRFTHQSNPMHVLQNALAIRQAVYLQRMQHRRRSYFREARIDAQASGQKITETLQDFGVLLFDVQCQRCSSTQLRDAALCIEEAGKVAPAARPIDRGVVLIQRAQLGLAFLSSRFCLWPSGRQQELLLLGNAAWCQERGCRSCRRARCYPLEQVSSNPCHHLAARCSLRMSRETASKCRLGRKTAPPTTGIRTDPPDSLRSHPRRRTRPSTPAWLSPLDVTALCSRIAEAGCSCVRLPKNTSALAMESSSATFGGLRFSFGLPATCHKDLQIGGGAARPQQSQDLLG